MSPERIISEKNLIQSNFGLLSKGTLHDEYMGFIGEFRSVRYYFYLQRSTQNNTWHYSIITFENHEIVYKHIGLWQTLKRMGDITNAIKLFKKHNFPPEVLTLPQTHSARYSTIEAMNFAKREMPNNPYKKLAFYSPRQAVKFIPQVETIPI